MPLGFIASHITGFCSKSPVFGNVDLERELLGRVTRKCLVLTTVCNLVVCQV
jgi:hypothetical protein